ncbi:BLUF domain-containing protein [Laspinema olomoucense]|uniref:BLUF domain-containing protein n=1 Tax=Laspinema olomoucense TaxID=3231600 RepID=UPI0021BA638D|nr:BLUF domain-containing protein [Laspinema sp. D3c]MCT7994573.1 BLUF domain-containing protein [Laspinema sp. D3c]
MKRLTYISKFSRTLSHDDIEAIGRVSAHKNQQANVTGVLLCLDGIFFQILEGEAEKIDQIYDRILADERHTDILCLKSEGEVVQRMFPDWSMQTINLDENTDLLIGPIKVLLQTLTESHRVLEKYTQPSIFKIISQGINPLSIRPKAVEKIVFFSDIVSFSSFAEKLPVEEVVSVVNSYFSICTEMITHHRGEVTKFIGDCVMAYFDGDCADDAIQASLDILSELENLRNVSPEGSPLRVLYSGIGLAKGKVIEGNIGSEVKKDYTILGDAVNVAARLEALTRKLSQALVFSGEVKKSAAKSWDFIWLADSALKGKSESIEIYSIDNEMTRKSSGGLEIARNIGHYLERVGDREPSQIFGVTSLPL